MTNRRDRDEADGGQPPIGALFGQLVDDTDRLVRAELALQRARLVRRLIESRGALVMGLVALLLGQAATAALLVGLVIALTPHMGALGATLVVVAGAILIGGVLAWAAIRRMDAATTIAQRAP